VRRSGSHVTDGEYGDRDELLTRCEFVSLGRHRAVPHRLRGGRPY